MDVVSSPGLMSVNVQIELQTVWSLHPGSQEGERSLEMKLLGPSAFLDKNQLFKYTCIH